MAKTVRLLLKDTTKKLPVSLRDPFLEETIKLEPDAEVSREFAKLLTDSFPFLYEVIDSKKEVDKSLYGYREDFKKEEFNHLFDQLTPEEKKHICSYVEELITNRGAGSENVFSNDEVNTEDAQTDNGSTE